MQNFASQRQRIAARPKVAVQRFELLQRRLKLLFRKVRARFQITQRKQIRPRLGQQLAAVAIKFFLLVVPHRLDAFLLGQSGRLIHRRFFLKNHRRFLGLLQTSLAHRSHQRPQICGAILALVTSRQLEAKSVLHRPRRVKPFQQRHRLGVNPAVDVGLRQIVIQLAHRLIQRLRLIRIWCVDVPQRDQLIERCLGICWRDLAVRRVHPMVSRNLVPARDALDGGRRPLLRIVNIHQNPPIHVLPHRQIKQVQQRGADIQQVRAVDPLVLAQSRTLGRKNPKLPVLGRWARGFARNIA